MERESSNFSPATLPGLGDCLDQITSYFADYLLVSESQARTLAVFVVHTHALDAADRTPYLYVSSPEKRCGKTLLLDALDLLVRNPLRSSNITTAALARKVDCCPEPTLLLDEFNNFSGGRGERAHALRGILNAGFQRGGTYTRCVAREARDFCVFCPKVIAGLGELPDTIADRSIPLRMKRAKAGEVRNRFDRRYVEPRAATLKVQIAALITASLPLLMVAHPARVDELNDRQNDIVEPLLAIADLAGANWATQVRLDLVELLAQGDDDSLSIRLLADIREIFRERGEPKRLRNAVLAQALAERRGRGPCL